MFLLKKSITQNDVHFIEMLYRGTVNLLKWLQCPCYFSHILQSVSMSAQAIMGDLKVIITDAVYLHTTVSYCSVAYRAW